MQRRMQPQATSDTTSDSLTHPGSGRPLDGAVRASFEPRFGQDFSQVRVHTDPKASGAARRLGAQAFTQGQDIYFGAGRYRPGTSQGQQLLGHELTHVVQQRQGRVQPTGKTGGVLINDEAGLEREAEGMGRKALQMKRLSGSDPSNHHESPASQTIQAAGEKQQTTAVTPEQLIDQYTNFIGGLDEEALGKDLLTRLPGQSSLVNGVLDQLSDSDRDDVAYAMSSSYTLSQLEAIPESLRLRLIREMVYGFVPLEEETEITRLWYSFGDAALPGVAEANRTLWVKSLWESGVLERMLEDERTAFKRDVIRLAQKYLSENEQTLIAEAQRFGINLDSPDVAVEEQPDYLKAVREVVPDVLRLVNKLDDLRKVHVGYNTKFTCDEFGICESYDVPVTFDPRSKPQKPLEKVYEDVKGAYNQVNAHIASFGTQFPIIYVLIQQDRLEDVDEAAASKTAQDIIGEALRDVKAKIEGADEKLVTGDISYYDLKVLHPQLLKATFKTSFQPSYPWHQPFYTDIANDVLLGQEAREDWADLGLTLVSLAALIATPFTGGASLAFLIGFQAGLAAGQAIASWEEYFDLATLADAEVKAELTLITEEQVDAKRIEAIIHTVDALLEGADVVKGLKGVGKARKMRPDVSETAEKGAKEGSEKSVKEGAEKGAKERAEEIKPDVPPKSTEADDVINVAPKTSNPVVERGGKLVHRENGRELIEENGLIRYKTNAKGTGKGGICYACNPDKYELKNNRWHSKSGDNVPGKKTKVPESKPTASPELKKELVDELENIRKELGKPKTGNGGGTAGVAKTDLPGLEEQLFVGASPRALQDAPTDVAKKAGPVKDPTIKSPAKLKRGQGHAEEVLVNKIDKAITSAKLTPEQMKDKMVWMHIEQVVCATCKSGLGDPKKSTGVLKAISQKYPEITFEATAKGEKTVVRVKGGTRIQ